jgi:hypothetical protein
VANKDEQIFRDCVLRIKASGMAKREQEIIQILPLLDDENDQDKIEALTKELMDIQKAKMKDKR